jgi:hypothetical protein
MVFHMGVKTRLGRLLGANLQLAAARIESKAEYETNWAAIHDRAVLYASQCGGNLGRVLSLLDTPDMPNANDALIRRFGFRVFGRSIRSDADRRYEQGLFSFFLQSELLQALELDVVNIVELGSGYGKNLFRLWLNGGPAQANYIGCEYTAAGRACAEYLASLEPNVRFISQPYDYYSPALISFDRIAKTFAFSSYSIEQIPEVGISAFDELLSIKGLWKVVHIEPVGWQRPTALGEGRLMREMEKSARSMSYNRNLFSVLETLERSGRIVVESVKHNFLAHRPNLPGTVITWSPAVHK